MTSPSAPRTPVAAARLLRALVLIATALAVLAGCSHGSSVSQVTVTAGATTVTLPVAMSCTGPTGATALTCSGDESGSGAPHLKLAPGTPVDVAVPKAVGDTPWVIVFSYVDAAGKKQGDRTSVFPAKQRFSYHLQPPKGAQLTRLEVQSLIVAPAPDGGVEFPAVRSWVLVVDPISG